MTDNHDILFNDWLDAVQSWLDDHAGVTESAQFTSEWKQFAASTTPVVTLFGAYDSGKSSLLRRLLVDSGAECPNWLTISGRHETFEVGLIEADGVMIRDTPGLSPEADDPRGLQNNRRALEAATLTDALLVVVPPQLATGELAALRQQLDGFQAAGSLRFVVSRFDEAGVDPTGDRSAYDELAANKEHELRQALELSDDVPVSVVAPDPWQLAGEERQPDPTLWDECRGWDGIAELRRELTVLPARAGELREAAAVRFWKHTLRVLTRNIEQRYLESSSSFETANQARKRTEQLIVRLDEFELAVSADLDGVLEGTLDQALQSGVPDGARIRERTLQALQDWYQKSSLSLSQFAHDAEIQFGAQESRPGWRDFDELLRRELPPSSEKSSPSNPDDGNESDELPSRLRKLNASLATSVKEAKTVLSKTTKDFSQASSSAKSSGSIPSGRTVEGVEQLAGKTGSALLAGEVLVAFGPTLVEIFGLVTDTRRAREQQRADRRGLAEIEERIAGLRRTVATEALALLTEDIESVRSALRKVEGSFIGLTAELGERSASLEQARSVATDLLSFQASGTKHTEGST